MKTSILLVALLVSGAAQAWYSNVNKNTWDDGYSITNYDNGRYQSSSEIRKNHYNDGFEIDTIDINGKYKTTDCTKNPYDDGYSCTSY